MTHLPVLSLISQLSASLVTLSLFAALLIRLKSQLLMNGNTTGMDINVDCRNGVVTLSVAVETDQEQELVVQIAKNTSGPASATDRLMIKPAEDSK